MLSKRQESVLVKRCQVFSNVSAGAAILVAVLVLIGWWLNAPALTGVGPGRATMKPNTALCFLLLGLALCLSRRAPSDAAFSRIKAMAARACASIVSLIGSASLAENIFGWDLGIDQLLFRDALLATKTQHPGLMAPASALAFMFLSAALLLLDWETRSNKRRPAQGIVLVAVMIGSIVMLGYSYGVQLLGVAGYSSVAIHSSVLFVIVGTGILFARPDRGLMAVFTSDRLGGLMARRSLPLLILLPFAVGWLRLKGQQAGYFGTEFGVALVIASSVIIFALVLWTGALWLNRLDLARSRAEERDTELAAIVHSSSEAIVGKTLDGTITSWNRGAQRLYGYTEEEALGQNISMLVPSGYIEDVPLFLAEVQKGFPVEDFETVRRRKDKVLIHVSLTISPVHDREGQVVGASSVARDITARKQAEERLRQSQTQLKGIIDSAMDAVITVDQDQRVLMFNASAEKMFDYRADEVVGGPLETLIPQKLRAGHAEHIRKFSNTGTTSRAMGALGALRGLRRNGVGFPIEASISQVEIGGKKFFTAIVRDVAERQQTEAALRESEASLKEAQHTAQIGSWRYVPGSPLTVSDEMYELYKLPRDVPVTYEAMLASVHPGDRARSHDAFQRALESGALDYRNEFRVVWPDSQVRIRDSRVKIRRDPEGKVLEVVGTVQDVTERKQAEEARQLAQARLVSALEGGRMGTWIWDIANNKIDWDNAMAVLFGRSPEELASGSIEPFFSWIHPDNQERAREDIEKVLRDGTNYDSEYQLFRPDRSLIWISSRGKVERDAEGKPFRMIGICTDITDRRKIEHQLLQSQKMEALGTLAGGIAHDFNNMLLAIGGNARLAKEELTAEHPVRANLEEIAKASARASSLVRQILAFSRRQSADRKSIAVEAVVREALALLKATLPARIQIRTNFSPGLPAISADSTQVHQVIMNLGTNAARAMRDQGGVLEVSAKAVLVTPEIVSVAKLREGNYVRLSVTDNGCGMDAATVGRIFDPFFSTQPQGEGTGLGLSVVHGIMKDHEGSISVYSEPGKGTVFHLYFPVTAQAATAEVKSEESPHGNGEHILFVDDEDSLVLLARRSLGRLGYAVTGFTDPARAVRAFAENPWQFSVVVTDLSMPGLSGSALARQLIAIRPDVPIVMTSGYIRPEDELEARDIGVRDLILKPDSIDDLAKALHRVFAGLRSTVETTH